MSFKIVLTKDEKIDLIIRWLTVILLSACLTILSIFVSANAIYILSDPNYYNNPIYGDSIALAITAIVIIFCMFNFMPFVLYLAFIKDFYEKVKRKNKN